MTGATIRGRRAPVRRAGPPRSPTSGCARTRWSSGRRGRGRPRCCCGCGPGSWPPGCAGTPRGPGGGRCSSCSTARAARRSRKVADRTRRVLRDAGARSTAIWPDEASLSLWALPPDRLVTTLLDLIEHGTGGAAYYTDVMEALVALAVYAPCGPPASSADFLTRLDADWLAAAYAASGDGEAVSHHPFGQAGVRGRAAAVPRAVAAARRGARRRRLVRGRRRLVLRARGHRGGARSRRRRRGRSPTCSRSTRCAVTGRSCCASMSSPRCRGGCRSGGCTSGRGRSGSPSRCRRSRGRASPGREDERQRVAATAEGGIWLLRTPRPSPVAELAGTQPSVDTSRRFAGAGAVGRRRAVADPARAGARRGPGAAARRGAGLLRVPRRGDVPADQAADRAAGGDRGVVGVRSPDGAVSLAASATGFPGSPAPPPYAASLAPTAPLPGPALPDVERGA